MLNEKLVLCEHLFIFSWSGYTDKPLSYVHDTLLLFFRAHRRILKMLHFKIERMNCQYEKQLQQKQSKERKTKYNGDTENLGMAPNETVPHTQYSRLSIISDPKIWISRKFKCLLINSLTIIWIKSPDNSN